MTSELIPINLIKRDGNIQSRISISALITDEYAEHMEEETKNPFPPLSVVFDGQFYWLWDGFHRLAAAEKVGWTEIECDVQRGTRRDAILFSCGANSVHGLRRTNADRRRAVQLMLDDNEWKRWSDRVIAEKCGVCQPFVSGMRKGTTDNGYQLPMPHTGADGKTRKPPKPKTEPKSKPAGINKGRVTVEPNMPIVERDEPVSVAHNVRQEAAEKSVSTIIERLADEFISWRGRTAQFVKNASFANRNDYRAIMHTTIDEFWEAL